jgi:hypothetical protein
MSEYNVMFTFPYHTVITTVVVENPVLNAYEDAVEAARELLRLEGVPTDGAQDIRVEVEA